jgi:hypothetical protein
MGQNGNAYSTPTKKGATRSSARVAPRRPRGKGVSILGRLVFVCPLPGLETVDARAVLAALDERAASSSGSGGRRTARSIGSGARLTWSACVPTASRFRRFTCAADWAPQNGHQAAMAGRDETKRRKEVATPPGLQLELDSACAGGPREQPEEAFE